MKRGTGQGARGTEKADRPEYWLRALSDGTELALYCAPHAPCPLPRAPLFTRASIPL